MEQIKYTPLTRNSKEAVLDVKNNVIITNWHDKIQPEGLLVHKSDYYVAYDKARRKEAIFHLRDKYNPVSEWHDVIYHDGLVDGESDFYIAHCLRGKYHSFKSAIFHKDNKLKPISQWHDVILPNGLVEGKSKYYIAWDSNNNQAIYCYENGKNKLISKRLTIIFKYGLIEGESDYYMVYDQTKEKKFAIFHVNNPRKPVTGWHDKSVLKETIKNVSQAILNVNNKNN